jgi:hypothetical protein
MTLETSQAIILFTGMYCGMSSTPACKNAKADEENALVAT